MRPVPLRIRFLQEIRACGEVWLVVAPTRIVGDRLRPGGRVPLEGKRDLVRLQADTRVGGVGRRGGWWVNRLTL